MPNKLTSISNAFHLVGFSPYWWMTRSLRGSKRISIVMYHSVSPISSPYNISPTAFLRQIKFIAENYTIARLTEVDALLLASNREKRKVLITFDDAFVNFQEFAYPVLKQFKVPCTVFVPTGFVGGANEWDLRLNLDFAKPIMSRTELLRLAREGLVDFGSHSVDHLSMRKLPYGEMVRQAVESKNELERVLQAAIEMFAYPYGQLRDFSDLTTEVLAKAGYKLAVTTRWGTLNSYNDRLRLRRISFEENDDCEDLRAKIDGVYDWFAAKERISHAVFVVGDVVRKSGPWARETHKL